MENPALTERRKIDALGAAGLADSLVPAPMLGFAQARLGESPTVGAIGAANGCCGNDMLDVDFAQSAGAVPDFGWLGGPSAPAQAPSKAQPGDAAGPADPLSSQMAQGNEGTWGPEDEMMLEKALNSGASESASAISGPSATEGSASAGGENKKYDQLFGQFGQSQEGNCASVAVIKAALDKYEGKVFQSVKKAGDGYDVTQQDGKKLTISKGELQKAAKAADLKGKPNEAKSMAVLMFATIAKRGAEEGMGSFDQVLKKLNSGFDPKKAAQLLGLGQKIKEVDPATAGQKDGVVAWNSKHAVYLDEGKADSYGQAKSADGTDTRGGKLTQAFTFA